MDKEIVRMRKESGEFKSTNPLVGFIYSLLRDGCPAGAVEEALKQMTSQETLYTNGWLARYSQDVAERLINNVISCDGSSS